MSGLWERHFSYIGSAAAWMANTKTKRTGQGLSPCIPLDVNGKVAFAVPTLVDISMFVYSTVRYCKSTVLKVEFA